jgi:hypothetical protein
MFKDPIVEEVRAVRKKHAERFNFNLRKIAEDLRAKEQQSGRKVVSFPPKHSRKKLRSDSTANPANHQIKRVIISFR